MVSATIEPRTAAPLRSSVEPCLAMVQAVARPRGMVGPGDGPVGEVPMKVDRNSVAERMRSTLEYKISHTGKVLSKLVARYLPMACAVDLIVL
ncbi:hypothetical protein F511_19790 [Dorcoceras hygrometricum]|uniref:Uncharacterized protein n=1 Tax=Dorcoceras hygrometricum TaxID=472368 RepID=A0A2Z7AYF2_9LAMI|nr:hypothetical protein F511_19790 [Dorcoceras hygrometricum]